MILTPKNAQMIMTTFKVLLAIKHIRRANQGFSSSPLEERASFSDLFLQMKSLGTPTNGQMTGIFHSLLVRSRRDAFFVENKKIALWAGCDWASSTCHPHYLRIWSQSRAEATNSTPKSQQISFAVVDHAEVTRKKSLSFKHFSSWEVNFSSFPVAIFFQKALQKCIFWSVYK